MTVEIIYEDDYIVVANKASGIAVSHKDLEMSLVDMLSKQVSQTLYLTHRLDQVVSGLIILAKSADSCEAINKLFRKNRITKKYLAVVVAGTAIEFQDLEENLYHNKKARKSFVDIRKGKLSKLKYKKLATSDRYELLEIEIFTGRFHQIRCILAHHGMPIKGDVKYGARRANKDRSIHLHAHRITFIHPYLHELVSFSAPLRSETLWQYFESKIQQ